ncbi:hypothetical protein HYN59_08610 [Flavobacterium album]|uniref:Uncharacterized protein n=1 Tax=Flavobacterium album TaxID=2175091 RepID=A0A2S1QXP1_9FLAO|nr:hypothetical protein HYN59_08610 [Flavobacterium album]
MFTGWFMGLCKSSIINVTNYLGVPAPQATPSGHPLYPSFVGDAALPAGRQVLSLTQGLTPALSKGEGARTGFHHINEY